MSLFDNLFVNLRVISKIPAGGKISTTGSGQIKIEDTKTLNGWLSTGRRRLNGDSREEAVKVLMQIINDASELSDNIIDSLKPINGNTNIGVLNDSSKKCNQLAKLCEMLKNSKRGIKNLHATYVEDANITARLDEVIDKIESQHKTIERVLDYMNFNRAEASVSVSVSVSPPQNNSVPIPHFQPQQQHNQRQSAPQVSSAPQVAPAPPQSRQQSQSEDDDDQDYSDMINL